MWLYYDINEFCRKAPFKIKKREKKKKKQGPTGISVELTSCLPPRESSISVAGTSNRTGQMYRCHFFIAEKTFCPITGSKNQEYKRKVCINSEQKNIGNRRRQVPRSILQTPALDKPVIKVWFTGTSVAVKAKRLYMRQGCVRLNPCWEMTVALLVAGTKNIQLGMAKHWVWEHIYKVNYCICWKKNIAAASY